MSSPKHSTTEKSSKGLSLHKQYYISGADLHFKVEHTLFRVHSYFFVRESPNFRERMAGTDYESTHDGLSDKTAIPIRYTSVEEFSCFLWIFYNPDYVFSSTPASAWCIILRLSSPSKWHFPKIHSLALNHLADLPLPLVERIVLYKQCSIQIDRLLPLYAELCLRDEPLTLEESVRLGHELSVPISQVRERVLRGEGRAVDDNNQGLGMSPIMEDPAISKEQVIELIKSALEITGGLSSIMNLRKLPKCSTTQQDTCDRSQSHVKASLRERSNKHSTTVNPDQVMTPESSNQNESRPTPSSSKGKVPEVTQEYGCAIQDQEQQQQKQFGCCQWCPCLRPSLRRSSGFILVEKSVSVEENLSTSCLPGSWV